MSFFFYLTLPLETFNWLAQLVYLLSTLFSIVFEVVVMVEVVVVVVVMAVVVVVVVGLYLTKICIIHMFPCLFLCDRLTD